MVVKRTGAEPVVDLTHKVMPINQDTRDVHDWGGAPPPGQGGRTQRLCLKCGQRMSVVGKDSPCPGRHSEAVSETIHDYDPF